MTEATEYSLEQSADGSLNSQSLGCTANGQRMNYAACLHRQVLLDKGDVKVPSDWAGCRTAARAGQCVALDMRKEELAAGKAIYIQPRSWLREQAEKARRWVMPWDKPAPTRAASPAPAPKPATTMLDALGNAGDLAAALSHAAARHTSNPPPPPAAARPAAPPNPPAAPVAPPKALPGESPLQMARRLAAEKAAAHANAS